MARQTQGAERHRGQEGGNPRSWRRWSSTLRADLVGEAWSWRQEHDERQGGSGRRESAASAGCETAGEEEMPRHGVPEPGSAARTRTCTSVCELASGVLRARHAASAVCSGERQEGSEVVVRRPGCRRGRNLRRVGRVSGNPQTGPRCFGIEERSVEATRRIPNPAAPATRSEPG